MCCALSLLALLVQKVQKLTRRQTQGSFCGCSDACVSVIVSLLTAYTSSVRPHTLVAHDACVSACSLLYVFTFTSNARVAAGHFPPPLPPSPPFPFFFFFPPFFPPFFLMNIKRDLQTLLEGKRAEAKREEAEREAQKECRQRKEELQEAGTQFTGFTSTTVSSFSLLS